MLTIPLTLTLTFLHNGQLADVMEKQVSLRVEEELAMADETVVWPGRIELANVRARKEGVSVLPPEGAFPIAVKMTGRELRAILAEGAGRASVTVPLKVEVSAGRKIIRDKAGQAEGAVDPTFATVEWDRAA